MNEEKIIEIVSEKLSNQYLYCQKNYYKNLLRVVLSGISTIVIILGGIIAWSYQPISDIQVLKTQVKIINGKLDVIIKNDSKKTINYIETKEL